MAFIRTSNDKWINIAHIATLETTEEYDPEWGERHFRAYSRDGEDLGEVIEANIPAYTVFVPALREITMVLFWMDDDQVEISRVPVVAWRIHQYLIEGTALTEDYATPITCEEIQAGTIWCLELGGEWLFPGDTTCTSFDQAKAHAAKCLQGIEDARRIREERKKAKQAS
jgi:hypothetical protein